MNKNRYISILILIIVVIILEFLVIIVKLNYFQIGNKSVEIDSYNEKYIVESVLNDYISKFSYINEDTYNEFEKVFTISSKISYDEIIKIQKQCSLQTGDKYVVVDSIIKTDKNQYKCEYIIRNDGFFLSDGIDENGGKNNNINVNINSNWEYRNCIILDINKSKKGYKVLYNYFDLGGGKHYEK